MPTANEFKATMSDQTHDSYLAVDDSNTEESIREQAYQTNTLTRSALHIRCAICANIGVTSLGSSSGAMALKRSLHWHILVSRDVFVTASQVLSVSAAIFRMLF